MGESGLGSGVAPSSWNNEYIAGQPVESTAESWVTPRNVRAAALNIVRRPSASQATMPTSRVASTAAVNAPRCSASSRAWR